jgi:hypothetical protein
MRAASGWLLLALWLPSATAAVDPSRFAYQAPILGEEARLLRLALDREVLEASRPGLADVRVVGLGGEEIPYLLLGKAVDQELVESRRVEVAPLEVRRERIEAEGRPPRTRQTVELPPPPVSASGWTLVVDPGVATTVRALELEGLVDGEPAWRQETSLFRLESGAARLEYALPTEPWDALRLVLVGEEGGYLDPRFRYASRSVLQGASPVELRLEAAAGSPEPPQGWTALVLERPRAVVPDRLEIATSTAFFDRAVRVWDRGPGLEPREIGSGRVFRVPSFTEVEQLAVVVGAARGDRLEVWIDSGDSPPLRDLEVRAVVDRPALVFARPSDVTGEHVATLLFGGGTVTRPRYDLASLAPPASAAEGPFTRAVRGSIDPSRAGRAWLGAIAPNPQFDAASVLAFARRAGAAVDAARFSHRFPVTVPAGTSGPVHVVVPAAALAVLAPNRGDLRIVDDGGRQWPYLWTHEVQTRWVEATLETRSSAGETELRLTPELAPVAADGLRLWLPEPVFVDRPYRLVARRPNGDEASAVEGRLRLEPSRDRAVLQVGVPSGPISELTLTVSDGDERPLEVESASIAVAEPVLYLVAPPGAYSGLVGDRRTEAARYDLERERDLVLTLPATPAVVGELEANPGRGLLAGWADLPLGRVGLWAALALAVLGMGLLAFRLVREE